MSSEKIVSSDKLREDLEELARKIKKVREDKKLTQEQLATRVGISAQHLRHLESPESIRSVPSAFVVAQIAKVTKLSVDYFLNHVRTQEEIMDEELKGYGQQGALTGLGLTASSVRGLSFEEKRDVLNVIRMTAKKEHG